MESRSVGGLSAGGGDPWHGGAVIRREALRTGVHPSSHIHLWGFPLEAIPG